MTGDAEPDYRAFPPVPPRTTRRVLAAIGTRAGIHIQSLSSRRPAPAQIGVQVQVRLIAKEQQRPVGLRRLSQKVCQLLHEVRAAQRTSLAQQLLGLLPGIAQRLGQAADGLAPRSPAGDAAQPRAERTDREPARGLRRRLRRLLRNRLSGG